MDVRQAFFMCAWTHDLPSWLEVVDSLTLVSSSGSMRRLTMNQRQALMAGGRKEPHYYSIPSPATCFCLKLQAGHG